MKVGQRVKAISSRCIGVVPENVEYEGRISKINQKSIVVEFDKIRKTFGSRKEYEGGYAGKCRYTFTKETSDGRRIYRSELNGVITI